MDWLTETPAYGTILVPQLLGVKITEICAGALLLLTLLTSIVGWTRHLSGRVYLPALVALATGIAAEITAHALHDAYIYWVSLLNHAFSPRSPQSPEVFLAPFLHEIANANHTATVLGWIFSIVTGVVVVLGLVHLWRLFVLARPRNPVVPLARDS
jgi:hypothetical protein